MGSGGPQWQRRLWLVTVAGLTLGSSSLNGVAGPPPNDDCANAIWAFDGDNPFTTIGATTDGPAHSACDFFGDNQVNQDIWFHYQAFTNDYLHAATCGSDFDTKLAVYEGCLCPVSDLNLLECNDDSCALQSSINIGLTLGTCYTIRVGGFTSATGTGVLNLVLAVEDPCAMSNHGCCTTGGPGCTDAECCAAVCLQDPFCCETEWDSNCLQAVSALCPELCVDPCTPDHPHDCFTTGILGCNDVACCEAVCCVHPFCCEEEWDAQCVALAELLCAAPCEVACPAGSIQEVEACGEAINDGCDMQYGCDGPFPDCCDEHAGARCSDPACSASVCSYDPYCCDAQWDQICASEACSDPNCQCKPVGGTPWQFIECGDVICGTIWSAANQHDTDAYTFWVSGHAYVEWSVASEYPVIVSLSHNKCPLNVIGTTTGKCASVASPLLEPGVYEVSVMPLPFGCVSCSSDNNHYVGTLSCNVPCPADVTGDSVVNVEDLLLVINWWGGPCYNCWPDVDNNGVVNVDDLLAVMNGWGACD